MTDETTSVFDYPVIDIYRRGDPKGYRVVAGGFDFSCLGAEMSVAAEKNMDILRRKLLDVCRFARSVDDFDRVAKLLEKVWPTVSETEFNGARRTGVMKLGFESVETTDNLAQFTRFSRMCAQLL